MYIQFFSLFILLCTTLYADPIYLRQKDFDHGSYIIDKPGTYVLQENISFNPNSTKKLHSDAYESGFLLPKQYTSKGGKYNDDSFGIGFFAAIVVKADDVRLDLNKYTIEQSKEHALLQRFFAVIETASQPFIPGQGPHNFGDQIKSAKNFVVENGTIGRSSHHGIHGNGNKNITIRNIYFKDFEVAAVALNGVNGLIVENCTAQSSKSVPILGTFSAARFLQPYIDYLVKSNSQTVLNIHGKTPWSARRAKNRLKKGIDAVYEDVIGRGEKTINPRRHPEEYALFHNSTGIIDGNCYGFLINSLGQAVEGFPVRSKTKPGELAKNITFRNVHVKELAGKVNEIIALRQDGKGMVDPVGAVFQVMNFHPDTQEFITIQKNTPQDVHYKGNFLANTQALIAKAYLNGDFKGSGLDLTRLNITQDVIDWIESDNLSSNSKFSKFNLSREDLLCNADSMFHVNKGVVAFKIDAAENVILERTSAENILNMSEVGSDFCGYYKISHPKATLEGCGGPKTRGYSFAGSSNISASFCAVRGLEAFCGSAVGFDVLTDSDKITINNSSAEKIIAGKKYSSNEGPNEPPIAVGFRISPNAKDVSLIKVYVNDINGYASEKAILDESHRAKINLQKNK